MANSLSYSLLHSGVLEIVNFSNRVINRWNMQVVGATSLIVFKNSCKNFTRAKMGLFARP